MDGEEMNEQMSILVSEYQRRTLNISLTSKSKADIC